MGQLVRHGTCAVGKHACLGQAHLVVCMGKVSRHSIPQHLQHVTILCDQPQLQIYAYTATTAAVQPPLWWLACSSAAVMSRLTLSGCVFSYRWLNLPICAIACVTHHRIQSRVSTRHASDTIL
jgi:hypothetical protein